MSDDSTRVSSSSTVVVSLVALREITYEAKPQLELNDVLEPFLALKAFLRLIIGNTLLNHLCAQHSLVG